MRNVVAIPVEMVFTAALILAMTALSLSFGLKISLPSGTAAILFVEQVALALLAVGLWTGWAARAGRRAALLRPVLAVICYAIVMIVHFNMKLWVPFVRPVTYDLAFWRIDQFVYPVVRMCMAIRASLSPIISYDIGFYQSSLFVMFYLSFIYYACKAPEVVRKLFLSLLILQGLGAIGYYFLPAIGPFLFEDGVNPVLTGIQHNMLAAYQAAVTTGPRWLIQNGESTLFAGLGAMPSLHAASSYVFVRFAWRHGPILLPTYIPLFAYIIITAIASRWHYLIDIPVGIALAQFSIYLAHRFDGAPALSRDADGVAPVVCRRLEQGTEYPKRRRLLPLLPLRKDSFSRR